MFGIPLLRGDQGVCYGEKRSLAEIILLLFGEEVSIGFERLLLILGGCTQTSHTPGPSPEGSFEMLFSI